MPNSDPQSSRCECCPMSAARGVLHALGSSDPTVHARDLPSTSDVTACSSLSATPTCTPTLRTSPRAHPLPPYSFWVHGQPHAFTVGQAVASCGPSGPGSRVDKRHRPVGLPGSVPRWLRDPPGGASRPRPAPVIPARKRRSIRRSRESEGLLSPASVGPAADPAYDA